jgi:hypothetical protein
MLAIAMLANVVGRGFLGGPTAVTSQDGALMFEVQDGAIDCKCLPTGLHDGLKFLLRRAQGTDGKTNVHTLVVELQRCINRPSRLRRIPPVLARAWLMSVLTALELQLEVSLPEPWWREKSCLELAPSPRVKRSRNISKAYIGAVLDASTQSKEPITPRGLLASSAILKLASGSGASGQCPNQGRTARCAKQDKMLKYFAEIRSDFEAPRALHYSVDGVQAGGDHNELFFAVLPKARLACLPPLQV